MCGAQPWGFKAQDKLLAYARLTPFPVGGQMRAVAMVALAMLGGSVSLQAQHGRAYEFGLFGSYTRYDAAFGLPNRVGGGVRLGYLFGDIVQAEADVLFPSEYKVGPWRPPSIRSSPAPASSSTSSTASATSCMSWAAIRGSTSRRPFHTPSPTTESTERSATASS